MSADLTERLRRVLEEEGFLRRVVTSTPTYNIILDATVARLAEAVDNHCLIEVMSRQAPAEKERDDWSIAYTKMLNRAEKAEGQLAGADEQNRSLQELLDEANWRIRAIEEAADVR